MTFENPFWILPIYEKYGGVWGVRGEGDGVAAVITVDGHCQGMTYPKGDQIWWFLPPFLKIIYIFYYIPTPSDAPGEPLYNWTWPLFFVFSYLLNLFYNISKMVKLLIFLVGHLNGTICPSGIKDWNILQLLNPLASSQN